ncbi:AraC family transcriptional regulator [Caldibacillus thermoamylovorans]|uniref:AraC family transcriptional regulator n=1 Tax=Caldibacillus thermoamylovorans TaxID=35841 RepID=UPI00203E5A71|nr:AraC family transcriptional regulator [Caldibacillus thermoamylovorans]MCM3800318.1 AraC family transcriptional regulator [Caldibacillus thermoamylovorans]
MMDASLQKKIVKQYYKARIENQKNEYLHPSYQLEQKLITAIKLGNEKEAISTLKEINKQKRAKLANNTLRSLKNSLIGSCTIFTRAAIQGGLHPESAYNLSDVLIQEIESMNDPAKLEEFEINMIYTFIRELKNEQLPKYTNIVMQTISYIHEHILHELSLEKIAKDLYIHPSYLSNIFKKETGTTVSNYINQKKIEESKYFLLHSELSISDISNLFRFCNQSYYTALFKKYTGVTPKDFRELNHQNES